MRNREFEEHSDTPPKPGATELVSIDEVEIGKRVRKDPGDITGLCESIQRIGLLQPVVITPKMLLISGERRVAAFKKLGLTSIPAYVVTNINAAEQRLIAECHENTERKAFTPEEAVLMGSKIEALEEPVAKDKQRQSPGRPKKGRASCPTLKTEQDDSGRTTAKAAVVVGMARRTYEKAKFIVEEGTSEDIEEMNRTGHVAGVFKKVKIRAIVRQIQGEPKPPPGGPFRVIVADPPWAYNKRSKDPSHRGSTPYPEMSLDEIKSYLDPEKQHPEGSILWLWTTNAHREEAFSVARAWGFEQKTILTWVKNRIGLGDWLRGKTEHCLLCVRGKYTVNLTNQTTELRAPVGKHSEKPEEFYQLVEELCPGSKLELFARRKRQGWVCNVNDG